MDSSDDFEMEVSSVDADRQAWFARLLFWRPSKLSDEQMRIHFSDWDGRWSWQTQLALHRLGSDKLDLNENWASSCQHWLCPGCNRRKDDIFRLSKRGVVLAKLELHHDHLYDRVWPRAQELFGVGWRDTIPKTSIGLLDQIRKLTSRFETCLLCSECNAADGKVKTRFRAHIDSRFTFTPTEIGQFVSPRSGHDHEIDYDRAWSIWEAGKKDFFARVDLIDELLRHVLSGLLTRDVQGGAATRSVDAAFSPLSLLRDAFYSETKDTERAGMLWTFRGDFLARSTQRDSAKVGDAASAKLIVAPTDDEYAVYVDPVSPKRWQGLSESWGCPVCERGKRHILRKSKAGKWTGGVRFHSEFTLETDERAIQKRERLFPEFRNDIYLSKVDCVMVCSDCANIGITLCQQNQSIREPYLSVDDRRASIVLSRPNSAHEISIEIAAERAMANESYRPALQAYDAFSSRVSDFIGRFERGRKRGVPTKELLDGFAEDIRVFHRIDHASEYIDLAKWILQQRSYFSDYRITLDSEE